MAFAGYPPPHHLLNDLGIETESFADARSVVRAPVTPFITGPDGGVRAGVIAVLVDMAGGVAGVRALWPDWMATADLSLQLVRPATGPVLCVRGKVVRRGRTTMVVEALVVNVLPDGSDQVDETGAPSPVAWATLSFAVLPRKDPAPTTEGSPPIPGRSAFVGDGLDRQVNEALGLSVLSSEEGRVSLPVATYLENSFGAVQGGVVALLGEAAGAVALRAADGPETGPVVVTDLSVAYLSLGRVGPITTRARVLAAPSGAAGGCAVVELFDEGVDHRLNAVINVRGHTALSPA